MSGKKNAGLRRSIDTVQTLLFFKILKVFAVFFRTGNGPSYGGTKGRLTASIRRKTWDT